MTISFFPDFLLLLPQLFAAVSVLIGLTLFSAYGTFSRSSGIPLVQQTATFLVVTLLCFLVLLVPVFSLPFFILFSSLLSTPFLASYIFLAVLVCSYIAVMRQTPM